MIRPATPADLPAIAGLIRDLAEYEQLSHEVVWSEHELGATLFGPDAVPSALVADADADADADAEGVVGMAIWYRTYSTFEARPGIWLEDLYVRPEHRGRGYGRALLEALFELAGDGRVEWSVLDWNEPSIRFYESLGACPVDGWTRYRWQRPSD